MQATAVGLVSQPCHAYPIEPAEAGGHRRLRPSRRGGCGPPGAPPARSGAREAGRCGLAASLGDLIGARAPHPCAHDGLPTPPHVPARHALAHPPPPPPPATPPPR